MKQLFAIVCLFSSLSLSAQWQRLSWPNMDTKRASLHGITCLKQVNDKVFACANNGLFISADFGDTWTKVRGFPPGFRPFQLVESSQGLFLSGTDPGTGFPYTGYENKDKTGLKWQPSVVLPYSGSEANSFVKIGNVYFAITFNNGLNVLQRSSDSGQTWQGVQVANINSYVSRFTWHRDTLYANTIADRRVFRSTDFGETFQLFSPAPIRGFQKTDGLFVGQLVSSSGTSTDTIVYSNNEGISWRKRYAVFGVDAPGLSFYKFGDDIFTKVSLGKTLYKYNFANGVNEIVYRPVPTFNSYDQNYQFGAVLGKCFVGISNDSIYKVCDSGPITPLSVPGNDRVLREMYNWQDSLFLIETQGGKNLSHLRTSTDKDPIPLAPVEQISMFSQTGHVYYNDTVYSGATLDGRIAKYHVASQTLSYENMPSARFTNYEVFRNQHYLAVRDYDVVFYRPLKGGDTWKSFRVMSLSLAANAKYFYYFDSNNGWLNRFGGSGVPEILPMPSIPRWPVDEQPVVSAHDSILMVASRDPISKHWNTLYLSTNFGTSFKTIDLSAIGTDGIFAFRYLHGHVFAVRILKGVAKYDPVTQTWTDLNDGLYEIPTHICSLNGKLLVACQKSGMYALEVDFPLAAASIDENQGIQIYPNPATTDLIIKNNVKDPQSMTISIYDVSGKLLSKKTLSFGECQLSMEDMPNGLLFLAIESGGKLWSVRVVHQ